MINNPYIIKIIDDRHIDTIFGICYLDDSNHFRLTNHNYKERMLHRLIWQDYHKKEIPESYVIHHKDFNPLNNFPENLILLTDEEHRRLHMNHRWDNGIVFTNEWKKNLSESHKGYNMPELQKIKIGEKNNKTGILRVYKKKEKKDKQGFRWKYEYYDENGKKKSFSSVRINKLKDKVLNNGLDWIIIDDIKAQKTFQYDKQIMEEFYE